MVIKEIILKNYRNYESAEIAPCAEVTVFTGGNAQGKTNILEAVYLCCTGRSHRTSHDRELIKTGDDIAYVKLTVLRRDGEHEVEIALSGAGKRIIKINGSRAARSGELLGTKWEDLPEKFYCYVCGATKEQFSALGTAADIEG